MTGNLADDSSARLPIRDVALRQFKVDNHWQVDVDDLPGVKIAWDVDLRGAGYALGA
jgi:hypothetical protein